MCCISHSNLAFYVWNGKKSEMEWWIWIFTFAWLPFVFSFYYSLKRSNSFIDALFFMYCMAAICIQEPWISIYHYCIGQILCFGFLEKEKLVEPIKRPFFLILSWKMHRNVSGTAMHLCFLAWQFVILESWTSEEAIKQQCIVGFPMLY